MEIGVSLKKRIQKAGLALGLILLFQTSLPLRAETGLIRAYQSYGSAVTQFVIHCRFRPTCSEYALISLEEEGFWVGNWMILRRLAHCSPVGAAIDYLSPEA